MKELIFVGGIQYQGKTSFCKSIEKINLKQVKYFSFDEIGKEFYDDKSKIFHYLQKYRVQNLFSESNLPSEELFSKTATFAAAVNIGEQIKSF